MDCEDVLVAVEAEDSHLGCRSLSNICKLPLEEPDLDHFLEIGSNVVKIFKTFMRLLIGVDLEPSTSYKVEFESRSMCLDLVTISVVDELLDHDQSCGLKS